ncbi:S8 family serine peptidase [Anaerolineales bacterium HSG6]|nr:S8 family serine peptidase [Anaerolineales bacterium HSG6]
MTKQLTIVTLLLTLLLVPIATQAQEPADPIGNGPDGDLRGPLQTEETEDPVGATPDGGLGGTFQVQETESVDSDMAALLSIAKEEGQVRVLVSLDVEYQPEGKMPRGRASEQRARISRTQDSLLNSLSTSSVSNIKRFEYIPAVALVVDAEGLAELENSPEVSYIHEDAFMEYSLGTSTQIIGANTAWDLGYTGEGWTVAVVDSGVDASHTFFEGRVVSEACYSSPDRSGIFTSTCPNGQSVQFGTGAGRNCNSYVSGCDHGTHVAGIVAGNGSFRSGVAPDANLIAIQVSTQVNSNVYCSSSPCAIPLNSDIISGLERVYALRNDYNIAAINLSIGGGRYYDPGTCDAENPEYKNIIDTLRFAGIPTIVASGNSGYADSMASPGCISSAISVGATNDYDEVASFSNSAWFLDLLAPGQDIYSSVPSYGYENKNGTSMATPHVAGAWAVRKQIDPEATIDDILAFFKRTGKAVTDPRNRLAKPRIQVGAELVLAATWDSTVNVDEVALGETATYSYQIDNVGTIDLSLSGSDNFGSFSFSPNPISPGETGRATVRHTINRNDLPGPLINAVQVTAKSSTGEILEAAGTNPVNLVAISLTTSADRDRAKANETINYSYQVQNIGNVTVTLSGQDEQYGSLSFSPRTLSAGQTATASSDYPVIERDLPGPIPNSVTVTGLSSRGTLLTKNDENTVDLTELLVISPTLTTTQYITTAREIVNIAVPPASLPDGTNQVAYTKLSSAPRLPAVPAGLTFDVGVEISISARSSTSAPLTYTINYDENTLPANVNEDDLAVYRYDMANNTWLTVTLMATDTTANTVSFTDTELSQFALTGQPYTSIQYLPALLK